MDSIQKILTLARFRNGAPLLSSCKEKKATNEDGNDNMSCTSGLALYSDEPPNSMARVCLYKVSIVTNMTGLAMMFQRELFFLPLENSHIVQRP
jgi:hypothetical protein